MVPPMSSPTLSVSKMTDVCHVIDSIMTATVTPQEGLARLHSIVERGNQLLPPGKLSIVILMSCYAAFGAALFGGGWAETGAAGISAALHTGTSQLVSDNLHFSRGATVFVGFVAALIATIWNSYITRINVMAATLASVCWDLPGLRFTTSMIDLSTNNPITGSSRMVSALFVAIQLGIGISTGFAAGEGLPNSRQVNGAVSEWVYPQWAVALFVLIQGPCCIILMDGKREHILQYMCIIVLSFWISRTLCTQLGALGTWIGAVIIGCLANLYGRLTRHPSIELFLIGILLLLPGSIGVRSVLASDSNATVAFFVKMVTIGVSLAVGLFTSNWLLAPKRRII